MNKAELERFQELESIAFLDGIKKGLECSTILTSQQILIISLKNRGHSFQNIADILNKKKSTVYTQYHRAILKISRK